MIVELIDGFRALESFGLHVVRARYVGSAEEAIAFAARRDARDDRAVPIVLRVVRRRVVTGGAELAEGPLSDHEAIRSAYRRITATLQAGPGRVLAQEHIAPGTDIVVEGRVDPALGKVVIVRCGESSVRRMIPFGEEGAAVLAEHVWGHHHHGPSQHERRMLAHLLLRVEEFFSASDVEHFVLDPVRLHENAYTIVDASIEAPRPLRIHDRLAPDARDRKGVGYRPSGRQ